MAWKLLFDRGYCVGYLPVQGVTYDVTNKAGW